MPSRLGYNVSRWRWFSAMASRSPKYRYHWKCQWRSGAYRYIPSSHFSTSCESWFTWQDYQSCRVLLVVRSPSRPSGNGQNFFLHCICINMLCRTSPYNYTKLFWPLSPDRQYQSTSKIWSSPLTSSSNLRLHLCGVKPCIFRGYSLTW